MVKVKGYIPPKAPDQQRDPSFAASMMGTMELFRRIKNTEDNLVRKVDDKIDEIESLIGESRSIVAEGRQTFKQSLQDFEEQALYMIKELRSLPRIRGVPGDPGKDADESRVVAEVLARIPRVDEDKLAQRIIKRLPDNKASLKIIQEKFETDPMSVIEKIMSLPEGKFKLKTSHIDGLEQTMSAFRNQLGRGYLHGGGLSTVSHDATLTGNGTPQDPLSVVSGGGSTTTKYVYVTAGGNETVTLPDTPIEVLQAVINGQIQNPANVSNVGANVTVNSATPAGRWAMILYTK